MAGLFVGGAAVGFVAFIGLAVLRLL